MSFIAELKRRKVFRTLIAYFVLCWLILQITDVMIPILDLPNWVAKLIFLLLMTCAPIVALASWAFDLSDQGIVRDQADQRVLPRAPQTFSMIQASRSKLWKEGSIVVGGIILFAVGASTTLHLNESRQISRDMERLAEGFALQIEKSLEHESTSLEVLRVKTDLLQSFEPSAFRQYAERLIAEHPSVRAVEWVPRVAAADIPAFEDAMRRHYSGFRLKQFDERGRESPPIAQSFHYPVSFTVPQAGNEDAIGYDLSSHPARNDAIRRSITWGSHQLSEMITLVQTERPGLLLFKPVFQDSLYPVSEKAREEKLIGLVLCVIDVDTLIKEIISLNPGIKAFEGQATLVDQTKTGASIEASFSNAQPEEYAPTYTAMAPWGEDFGVSFLIQITPSRAMVREAYSTLRWWIGGSGLLLSIMVGLVFRSLYQHRITVTPPGLRLEAKGPESGKLARELWREHEA